MGEEPRDDVQEVAVDAALKAWAAFAFELPGDDPHDVLDDLSPEEIELDEITSDAALDEMVALGPPLQYVEPDKLAGRQLARVEALKEAKAVLTAGGNIFGGGGVPVTKSRVRDLIRIATYIETGGDPGPQKNDLGF